MAVRVRLRPVTMDDLDDIMSWVNDPDVTANIANIQKRISRAQEAAWLMKALENPNERIFSILDADTGAYVGQCGIHSIYWPARNGRTSVIIKKEYQGKGYGRAASIELLRVAFRELGMHKVWCIVWEDNPKTVHLNTSIGFRQEGRLIEEYYLDGKYHHMLRLYMLKDDFERLYGGSAKRVNAKLK
jgi:RimJ/RimL family protein N-acetyltransferase